MQKVHRDWTRLLSRYSPVTLAPAHVESLWRDRRDLLSADAPAAGRSHVVLLHVDLRDEPGRLEKLDTAQLADCRAELLSTCTDLVSRYGGVCDSLLGDGLRAYFDAPIGERDGQPNDAGHLASADSALQCADGIVDAIAQSVSTTATPIGASLFLHSGWVTRGVLGADDASAKSRGGQYSVFGEGLAALADFKHDHDARGNGVEVLLTQAMQRRLPDARGRSSRSSID
jgi:class 3 adenylate cyclase